MILVIGGGVAGLSCALAAVEAGADGVTLAVPGRFAAPDTERAVAHDAAPAAACNTALAQGGIAAAVGPGDRASNHLADTLAAGAGLVDAEAAGVLVRDGAAAMRRLLAAGLPIDRAPSGELELGLEGAHGRPRIAHAGGDRTGAVLQGWLVERALAAVRSGRLTVLEEREAVSLMVTAGQVTGAALRQVAAECPAFGPGSTETLATETLAADAVVLATGGYAALFPRTSNHAGARGAGIVLAARAGAVVADLEFVQFHPTVLHGTGDLISEAVRGAGAVLRDGAGNRFMVDRHPFADLAPRDVVSREIHRVLRDRGEECVWLDATGLGAEALNHEFPGISTALRATGIEWGRELVPVSPAAHYTMGGIATDLDGRTTVPGLFAAGETASTGVHGANRLASNSLLEGLVFGQRAGESAAAFSFGARPTGARLTGARAMRTAAWGLRGSGANRLAAEAEQGAAWTSREQIVTPVPEAVLANTVLADDSFAYPALAAAITDGLGIERDAAGLAHTARVAAACAAQGDPAAQLAAMIAEAAARREESRGAHQRADYPSTDRAGEHRRGLRYRLSAATRRDPSPTQKPSTIGANQPAPASRREPSLAC